MRPLRFDFHASAASYAAALLLAGTAGTALAAPASAEATQLYRQTAADCRAGRTQQSQADCLREAGAALQETRRGHLQSTDAATLSANAVARCARQPTERRASCEKLARGEGTSAGSVAGGGVLRTLVETVPGPAPAPAAAPR